MIGAHDWRSLSTWAMKRRRINASTENLWDGQISVHSMLRAYSIRNAPSVARQVLASTYYTISLSSLPQVSQIMRNLAAEQSP